MIALCKTGWWAVLHHPGDNRRTNDAWVAGPVVGATEDEYGNAVPLVITKDGIKPAEQREASWWDFHPTRREAMEAADRYTKAYRIAAPASPASPAGPAAEDAA